MQFSKRSLRPHSSPSMSWNFQPLMDDCPPLEPCFSPPYSYLRRLQEAAAAAAMAASGGVPEGLVSFSPSVGRKDIFPEFLRLSLGFPSGDHPITYCPLSSTALQWQLLPHWHRQRQRPDGRPEPNEQHPVVQQLHITLVYGHEYDLPTPSHLPAIAQHPARLRAPSPSRPAAADSPDPPEFERHQPVGHHHFATIDHRAPR